MSFFTGYFAELSKSASPACGKGCRWQKIAIFLALRNFSKPSDAAILIMSITNNRTFPNMSHQLYEPILAAGVVAILRGLHPEKSAAVGEILAAAGVKFMEVPLNTPDAPDSIARLARRFHGTDVHIGAGTVLTPTAVAEVKRAGGEFVISPNVRRDVIAATVESGMLSMPGFATPTEAFEAIDSGAHLLKVFPCGNPRDIAIMKSVIPLPVFAVGGIDKNNKRDYLKVAAGVGVGIGIFNPEATDLELRIMAEEFMLA